MIKVALTHDIDRTSRTYQTFTKPLTALAFGDVKKFKNSMKASFKRRNYWRFPDIIAIEKKYGVKSSFYFLNESIKFNVLKPSTFVLAKGRYSINDKEIENMIRWLDQNGWEIGVHGSFNSYNDKRLLQYEKQVLEKIIGHEVIGIRQHHLNMDSETWKIQNEIGLLYDTSFGSNYHNGFKNDRYLPFRPFENEFVVFPMVIMDFVFMNDHNRWDFLEMILDKCEENDSILVVNYHNAVFNDYDYPGYKDSYIKIIERCIERGAVFKTLAEYYSQEEFNSKA